MSQAEILQAPDAVVREAGPELAKLFEYHARMVLGICRALLRDGYEAEDAAQQTFLSAYRSLLAGTYPRDGAAWLATIARNECRARIRKRMATPIITRADDTVGPVARDVADVADQRAQLRELRAAIAELPQRQREAVLLRDFQGLSYHELAVALSTSSPAVESLLIRARRTISRRVRDATECALTFPATLREQLERAIPHFEVAQTAVGAGGGIAGIGVVGKVLALPLTAKVTAATVGVVAVGMGVGVKEQASRSTLPLRAAALEQTAAKPDLSRLDGSSLTYRRAPRVISGDADTSVLTVGSWPVSDSSDPPGTPAESAAAPGSDSPDPGQSADPSDSAAPSGPPPEASAPVEPASPEAGVVAPTSPGEATEETTSTVGSTGSGSTSNDETGGSGAPDDSSDPGDSGLPTSGSVSDGTRLETEDATPTKEPEPEREDDSSAGADRSPSSSEGAGSEPEGPGSGSDAPGPGSGSSGERPVTPDDGPAATDGDAADPAGGPADEAPDDSGPSRADSKNAREPEPEDNSTSAAS